MDRKTGTSSIFVFIFSFVFAVFVSSFVSVSPFLGVLLSLLGVIIIVSEKILKGVLHKEVLFLSLALLAFGLGTLRFAVKDYHEALAPTPQGFVISEPEQKENSTRFVFESDNGERVLVSTDLYSPVQYGDSIRLSGKLEIPWIIEDEEGGRPFDYGAYLSKDDIYHTMSFAKIEVLSSGNGNFIKEILFKIKQSFVDKVRLILEEPESSLLAGLIVAGKTAIPKNILEEFRNAGIIHIVVLSGYNITIIADFIKKRMEQFFLLTRLRVSPKMVAGSSILAILLFVLMTGAEATVVRAAIMVLVVIMAKMFGRTYSAERALLLAAFLMVVHNPKILVFDPSFQLSFLATCALIYIVPIVERYSRIMPNWWGMRTILVTTVSTQLMVLPLLVYSMGNISLVSVPANLLVLLIIPWTMLLGFIAALIAYISPLLALPFSYIAHLFLSWILNVSHYLGSLPFASIDIPALSVWLVALIYLGIIIFVWRWRNYSQRSAN